MSLYRYPSMSGDSPLIPHYGTGEFEVRGIAYPTFRIPSGTVAYVLGTPSPPPVGMAYLGHPDSVQPIGVTWMSADKRVVVCPLIVAPATADDLPALYAALQSAERWGDRGIHSVEVSPETLTFTRCWGDKAREPVSDIRIGSTGPLDESGDRYVPFKVIYHVESVVWGKTPSGCVVYPGFEGELRKRFPRRADLKDWNCVKDVRYIP